MTGGRLRLAAGCALCLLAAGTAGADDLAPTRVTVARLKYGGGGDWYNDRSVIPNMLAELHKRTGIAVQAGQAVVELSDDRLFNYPVIYMTGHGNISFSADEAERLRLYLENGGFLYADDDYGMDAPFRREMKKVFPAGKMVELPFAHPVYRAPYPFPDGLPKIHEHDNRPPRGYGYLVNGRLAVFYTYETNISDGWADPDVHNDPPEKREEAFRMGTNIIVHALTQ